MQRRFLHIFNAVLQAEHSYKQSIMASVLLIVGVYI